MNNNNNQFNLLDSLFFYNVLLNLWRYEQDLNDNSIVSRLDTLIEQNQKIINLMSDKNEK